MLFGTAMVSLILASAGGVSTASAHNDSCTYESGWRCTWGDASQAPGVMHWFYAENTLRYWTKGRITGESGYYVTNKCTHITHGGFANQVACGWGTQTGEVASAWRPGYLWTRHGASGPRSIWGTGWH